MENEEKGQRIQIGGSGKGPRVLDDDYDIVINRLRMKLTPIADILAFHNQPIVDGDMCADAIVGMGYILQEITDELGVLGERIVEEFRKAG